METTTRTPGQYIREELDARGWTQEVLSKILNRPMPTVNEIIQGKRAIMPEMAISLGLAFDMSPSVWMEREAAYRLSLVQPDDGETARRAKIFGIGPIKEMQKRGWVRTTSKVDELEQDIRSLFQIESVNDMPQLEIAMRRSGPAAPLTPSQRAWCCRVRQMAKVMKVAEFKESRLDACQTELRKLAAFPQEVRKVPNVLALHGIRFVIVEPLPSNKIDGAAMWLDSASPVIAVSTRYDRIDAFWHTLCHEFAHIRYKDAISVDSEMAAADGEESPEKPMIEVRADEAAASMLIPKDLMDSFILRVKPLFSKERINQFANRLKIHPGIIVGQLQHRKAIGFHANREMLVKIRSLATAVALTDGWGHSIDTRIFT